MNLEFTQNRTNGGSNLILIKQLFQKKMRKGSMTIPNEILSGQTLQRFIEAQDKCYERVIKELSQGKKTTHWIWYIFPQVFGLGFSDYSKYYGIHGLVEAKSYWSNSLLRARYLECLELVIDAGDIPEAILGFVDAKKLQSSITLFLEVDPCSEFLINALDSLYFGELDSKTIEILMM